MKKIIKTCFGLAIFLVLTVVLLVAGLNLANSICYGEFNSTSKAHGDMPGLGDGFIPQGLAAYDGGFLHSGYMKDKSASRLYYVKDGEEVFHVSLKNLESGDATWHCGGIAIYDKYVYIGGSGGLYVFLLEDVFDGNAYAYQIGKFDAGMTASWVYVYGNELFIGTYADGGKYNANDWQSAETPAGEQNPSLMAMFKLDGGEETFGIRSTPSCAYSIRDRVQGAAVTDKGIILSTSSGITTSVFYFYEIVADYSATLKFGGADGDGPEIPLYYLDSKTLRKTISAIPMAEEIEFVDGRLYVSNESACQKYLFGWLVGGQRMYSFEVKDEYFMEKTSVLP